MTKKPKKVLVKETGTQECPPPKPATNPIKK